MKYLLQDRAALAAAREAGLVGTAPNATHVAGVGKQHEEEELCSKPKRTRKKTDARKAIERAKLEAKHAKRAAAAAAEAPAVSHPVDAAAGPRTLRGNVFTPCSRGAFKFRSGDFGGMIRMSTGDG